MSTFLRVLPHLFYFILFVLSLSVTKNTVGNAANIDFSPQAGWHINRTLFLRLLYGQPFVFYIIESWLGKNELDNRQDIQILGSGY